MLEIKTPARGIVAHGVSACAGCGLELAMRILTDEVGRDSTIIIPPGCSALFSGFGKETAMQIPGFQGNLENTAAYAAGVKAGYEMLGKEDITVIGFAGDGATVDIGLQALSGALERGDKIFYICYDNEAYMNTGIQGSGSTPLQAWTTTTPSGKNVMRKDMMQIVAAHRIPYAATASVAYPEDLRKKIQKALKANKTGPVYLHIHIPCPTGWGSEPSKSIEIGKLAVDSNCWPLYEIENGVKTRITKKVSKPKPVNDYLMLQKRFKDVNETDIENIQNQVDSELKILEKRCELV